MAPGMSHPLSGRPGAAIFSPTLIEGTPAPTAIGQASSAFRVATGADIANEINPIDPNNVPHV